MGSYGLFDLIVLADDRRGNRLDPSRGPVNLGLLEACVFAESKMQAALVLGAETTATRNVLDLSPAIPKQPNLSPDRAAVAGCALEIESDPFVFRGHGVLVEE